MEVEGIVDVQAERVVEKQAEGIVQMQAEGIELGMKIVRVACPR